MAARLSPLDLNMSPLGIDVPRPTGAPRSPYEGARVMSCADMTEGLMAEFGSQLGLNVISEIVLAVLAEHHHLQATPIGHSLAIECANRLALLAPGNHHDRSRAYPGFPISYESDDD
jgi:hypothetical protein